MRTQTMRTQTLGVNGSDLFTCSMGAPAAPLVLFLHGFPLNSFQWRGAFDRLAVHRRCVAPDFLALGHTEVAEGQPVGPDDQAAMLAALLDALSLPRVEVIANDSGGAVGRGGTARRGRTAGTRRGCGRWPG